MRSIRILTFYTLAFASGAVARPDSLMHRDSTVYPLRADEFQSRQGVWIRRAAPVLADVQLRGLSGRELLFSMNGMRLNPAYAEARTSIAYPALFSRLDGLASQVVSGAPAAAAGEQAVAGVWHYRNDSLRFARRRSAGGALTLRANAGATGEAGSSLRIYARGSRVMLEATGSADRYRWYRFPGARGASLRFPYGQRLEGADYTPVAGMVRAGIRLFRNVRAEVLHLSAELPGGPEYAGMVMGYSYLYRPTVPYPAFGFASGFSPLRVSINQAALYLPAAGRLWESAELRAAVHLNRDHRIERLYSKTPVFGNNDPTFTLLDQQEVDRASSRQAVLRGTFTTLLGPALTLRWGAEASYEKVHAFAGLYNLNDQLLFRRQARIPDGSDLSMAQVFGTLNGRRGQTDWEAGFTLRHHELFMAYEGVRDQTARGLDPMTFRTRTAAFYVQARHPLRSGLTLQVQAGRTPRSAGMTDLLALGPKANRTYVRTVSSPDAEVTRHLETGLHLTRDGFDAAWTLYGMDQTGMFGTRSTGRIVDFEGNPVPDAGPAPIPGQFTEYRFVNGDRRILGGTMLSVRGRLADGVTGGFEAHALTGRTHSAGSSQPAAALPPAHGRAWIMRQRGALSAGADIRFAFARETRLQEEVFSPWIDPAQTSAFAAAGVSGSWQVSRRARLHLRVDNLFNQTYREFGSALDAPGRSLSLAFQHRF